MWENTSITNPEMLQLRQPLTTVWSGGISTGLAASSNTSSGQSYERGKQLAIQATESLAAVYGDVLSKGRTRDVGRTYRDADGYRDSREWD